MLFAITGCSSDSDAVAQANDKEVDWQIAGTIVQLIDHTLKHGGLIRRGRHGEERPTG